MLTKKDKKLILSKILTFTLHISQPRKTLNYPSKTSSQLAPSLKTQIKFLAITANTGSADRNITIARST